MITVLSATNLLLSLHTF